MLLICWTWFTWQTPSDILEGTGSAVSLNNSFGNHQIYLTFPTPDPHAVTVEYLEVTVRDLDALSVFYVDEIFETRDIDIVGIPVCDDFTQKSNQRQTSCIFYSGLA